MSERWYAHWESKLMVCDSQRRGIELIRAAAGTGLTDDEKRRLINEFWTVCEAWGDMLDYALAVLARLKPVGDPLPERGTLTVYRATGGLAPDGGCWTLRRDVADFFARMINSPRGAILGIHSLAPTVWRAEVDAKDVLGYFDTRNEAEVVVPHAVAHHVEPV
jgi:hypothetical protein